MSVSKPGVLGQICWAAQAVVGVLCSLVVHLGTLPYYRFFQYNTLGPIESIAMLRFQAHDSASLVRTLSRWRERKLSELQFISIACAVLTGAVIGCLQWQTVPTAYWLAVAFWYSSIVFSILGILLAAQQIAVLNFLGPISRMPQSKRADHILELYLPLLITKKEPTTSRTHRLNIARDVPLSTWRPRWRMVFIWQCPIMFMSYSVCSFFLGLTLLVITPLIQLSKQPWNSDADIAVIYMVVAAIACVAFIYCSYWIYHDVGMERDVDDNLDVLETLQEQDIAIVAKFLRDQDRLPASAPFPNSIEQPVRLRAELLPRSSEENGNSGMEQRQKGR